MGPTLELTIMTTLIKAVPGGKLLSLCRAAEPRTGTIEIPLPPKLPGQLILHWEHIPAMLAAQLLDRWWGPVFAFQTPCLGHFV